MIAQFEGFEINPVHGGDAWKICNFCVANADRLKRFFPKTLEQNLTPTLSQIFVEIKVKQFENKEEFLFTLKETDTRNLAGLIYLKELNWDSMQGEYAYCVGYTYKGNGLITKAINALNNYALNTLHLKTIQIIAHKSNKASINVALNNDFTWVKTIKQGFTPNGEEPLDMELYELYNT